MTNRDRWLDLIERWSKSDGYSAIARCANVFIREDLKCDPITKLRLEQLRDKAWSIWGQSESDEHLTKNSLIHKATMSVVQRAIKENKLVLDRIADTQELNKRLKELGVAASLPKKDEK